MWSRAYEGDIPVYWYQWHDTWHGTWGTVTLPGWSPLQLLFYLVMTSRSPLCSPPPLIQFPSHLAWRGGSVSQNIEVSPVFYSVKTNQSRWHVTHVTPAWPSDESWHTGEPLMRCHNDTGARVIYRGLESAKLSRSGGLPPPGPPSDTDTIKLTKTRALTFIEEILIHDQARLTGAGQSNIH